MEKQDSRLSGIAGGGRADRIGCPHDGTDQAGLYHKTTGGCHGDGTGESKSIPRLAAGDAKARRGAGAAPYRGEDPGGYSL